MRFDHRPVLREAVIQAAAPVFAARPDALIVDGTVGGGGHAAALLGAAGPAARLLGVDRDPVAVLAARGHLRAFGKRARVLGASYATLDEILARELKQAEGVVDVLVEGEAGDFDVFAEGGAGDADGEGEPDARGDLLEAIGLEGREDGLAVAEPFHFGEGEVSGGVEPEASSEAAVATDWDGDDEGIGVVRVVGFDGDVGLVEELLPFLIGEHAKGEFVVFAGADDAVVLIDGCA